MKNGSVLKLPAMSHDKIASKCLEAGVVNDAQKKACPAVQIPLNKQETTK